MTGGARWRSVGIALGVGAFYDLAFGVAILGCTRRTALILCIVPPGDPVYLYLNGVFLLLLAGIYAAAAREPDRYSAVAPISAGGRVLGFLLFLWAWAAGRPVSFLVLGTVDLVFAAATLVAWCRATRLSD